MLSSNENRSAWYCARVDRLWGPTPGQSDESTGRLSRTEKRTCCQLARRHDRRKGHIPIERNIRFQMVNWEPHIPQIDLLMTGNPTVWALAQGAFTRGCAFPHCDIEILLWNWQELQPKRSNCQRRCLHCVGSGIEWAKPNDKRNTHR